MIFLPHFSLGNENCEHASNQIPYPPYPYLSGSAFFVKFTAPKQQLPSVKFVFKSLDHI